MRQKFPKLTFVYVTKNMPTMMKHFDCDFIGIVDGTYSQLYGGNNIDSYGLYKVEDGKIVNRISWYKENQLTEYKAQDKKRAEQMIEDYNFDV